MECYVFLFQRSLTDIVPLLCVCVCVCVCLCVGNGEKTHLFSSYFGGYTPYAWTTKSLTGDSAPESS